MTDPRAEFVEAMRGILSRCDSPFFLPTEDEMRADVRRACIAFADVECRGHQFSLLNDPHQEVCRAALLRECGLEERDDEGE